MNTSALVEFPAQPCINYLHDEDFIREITLNPNIKEYHYSVATMNLNKSNRN